MEIGSTTKCWLRVLFLILFMIPACKVNDGQSANQRPPVNNSKAGDVTEITLERGACNGECPVYQVTFRQNRPAIYIGDAYVPLIGTYEADSDSCSECYFAQLVTWLEVQQFYELEQSYRENLVDSSRITVSVVRSGSKISVVSNDSKFPIELWGIAMAIDGVASKIKWNKVSAQRLK